MSVNISGEIVASSEIPTELEPVLVYWKSITPEGAIGPTWRNFDMMRIPSPLLPYTVVADFDGETGTFSYRFWGSRLTDVFRADYTGKTIAELPERFRKATIDTYSTVIKSKSPSFVQFSTSDNTPIRFQKAYRLPLSNDGQTVTNIISILLYPWLGRELKHQAETHLWSK